jgi:hypothetical protein
MSSRSIDLLRVPGTTHFFAALIVWAKGSSSQASLRGAGGRHADSIIS